MSRLVRVSIEAQMSVEELEGLFLVVRNWENARPEIKLAINVEPIDQIEDVEDILRRIVSKASPPLPHLVKRERRVHLLHHGVTACGLGPTPEKPDACQWLPIGDLWVEATPEMIKKVTCPDCNLAIERLEELVRLEILKVVRDA